jgi:hypothetical protein
MVESQQHQKQVLFTDEDEHNFEIVAHNLQSKGVDVKPENGKTDAEYSHTKVVRYLLAQAAHGLTDTDDQAYFWTEEWQAAERRVDEDIAAGRYKDFATMEDFLADLANDDEE